MKSGITTIATVPVRAEPSEKSEMVSQLLFGERYGINEEKGDWLRVTSFFDNYEGWISRNQHCEPDEKSTERLSRRTITVLPSNYCRVTLPGRYPQLLSAGSELPDFDAVRSTFIFMDDIAGIEGYKEINPILINTAKEFLGSPYLWGGRSVFGCDCSGFVQVVHKIHGISLPRDASQQSLAGKEIENRKLVVAGDLAFFRNEKGSVIHAAIFTSPDKVIHCSGMVRYNSIDDTGILDDNQHNYTHRSYVIKRIFL